MAMRVVIGKMVEISDSVLNGLSRPVRPFNHHSLLLFCAAVVPMTFESIYKAETKAAKLKESWLLVMTSMVGVTGYLRGHFDENFILIACCACAISALTMRLIHSENRIVQLETNTRSLENRVAELETSGTRKTPTKSSPYNLRRSARKAPQ